MVHLDGSRSVRVDLLLRNGFDLCFLGIPGEGVVQQRSWSVERLLEKRLVVLLRDDRCAFGHHRRQPSGVIGVRMRVHHVADRLVGNELLRFGDVRESARLGLSGLEHHDVILELHNHRIVAAGSGGEPVEAVAELFGSDGQRRRGAAPTRATGGTATACGRGRRRHQRGDIGRIRLRRGHVDFEEGPPAARLHDLRRRHDAAEVLPARVGGEDVHVAHDVFTQPGLDPFDDVLVVHVAVDDVVLAGRRFDGGTPGQDGVVLAVDLAAARGGVVLGGAFQKSPGRDVELQGVGPGLRDIRLSAA